MSAHAPGPFADQLLAAYRDGGDALVDFWGRRAPLAHAATAAPFGRRVELIADHPAFVTALEAAAPRYSRADPVDAPPLRLEAGVAADAPDPGPLPDDLGEHLSFQGRRRWITVRAGAWGQAWADPAAGQAWLIAHPRLAARPDLLRTRLLDTVLLNLLIGAGLGLLHASCLVADGGGALLLLGDHNTGKTTTSLRAVRAGGFRLLTDSMVFVDACPDGQPRLHGFPVGRIKLRADVAAAFLAELDTPPDLTAEPVRGETKHVLDLTAFAPDRVLDTAAPAGAATLCLLQRTGRAATATRPAAPAEVTDRVLRNSRYFDAEPAWRANAGQLGPLLDGSRHRHLEAGTDAEGLVAVLRELARG